MGELMAPRKPKPFEPWRMKPRAHHPSGKPEPRGRFVGASRNYARPPNDEPLTPGLRPGRAATHAIGFLANHHVDDDDFFD